MPSDRSYDPSSIASRRFFANTYCWSKCDEVEYKTLPSGTMYGRFPKRTFLGWILSVEDSLARISALQAMELAWTVGIADYSSKLSDCYEVPPNITTDHHSFFLKTYRQLELEEPNEYAKNWPKSGMIVSGTLIPLQSTVHPIGANDGGFLPTPQASDCQRGPAKYYDPKHKRQSYRTLVTYAARHPSHPGKLNPRMLEWMMGYPIGWTELER